jgi:hypothetical protein
MIDPKIWADQEAFNNLLREPPTDHEGRIALAKEFSLHMVSEITEMLNALGVWQMHRSHAPVTVNDENVRRQLIDQFKYWMSLCQVFGYTPAQMTDTYWAKSATVRQRFAQEFAPQGTFDRPTVVLDMDNVLADYTTGFGMWFDQIGYMLAPDDPQRNAARERARHIVAHREYFSHRTMGLTKEAWQIVKDAFAHQHGYGYLPPMPELPRLTAWIAAHPDVAVVVMTARKISRYPNVQDDTILWLQRHDIPFHALWWGEDKPFKLRENLPTLTNIRFVVDDDPAFLAQYVEANVPRIYWMRHAYRPTSLASTVIPVDRLDDVVEIERGENLHLYTAAVDADFIASIDECTRIHTSLNDLRRMAKVWNFNKLYGSKPRF